MSTHHEICAWELIGVVAEQYRRLRSRGMGLDLFVCGDQLRKGAAL
jgi:hypothetical protein